MELRPIHDQQLWDDFVQARKHVPFLQSFAWGEFQKQRGFAVERIGIWDRDILCLATQLIQHRLPLRYEFVYAPHGPLFAHDLAEEERRKIFLFFLGKFPQPRNSPIFFRCDPQHQLPQVFEASRTFHWVQPEYTQLLSLATPTDQLLSRMKQKTRYNIRLAAKKGVQVTRRTDQEGIRRVVSLICETLKRRGLRAHTFGYYQDMLKYLGTSDIARLYVAEAQDQTLAVGIFLFYGDTVTYLHGGSSVSMKSVMAPYVLQWQVICDAQKERFRYFDFGGVAPLSNDTHKLSQVTRFKTGFGGEHVRASYLYEFPLRKYLFRTFLLVKKLRSLL